MNFAKAFGGTLVALLVLEIFWIVRVVRPMYDQQVGAPLRANPQLGAAALFYATYAAGLAHGTYAFTNSRGDVGWGIVLTAVTAVCRPLAARLGRLAGGLDRLVCRTSFFAAFTGW